MLVTDGASDAARAEESKKHAAAMGVSILGVGIGIDVASLRPWCDEAVSVTDLDRLDETTSETLFST